MNKNNKNDVCKELFCWRIGELKKLGRSDETGKASAAADAGHSLNRENAA